MLEVLVVFVCISSNLPTSVNGATDQADISTLQAMYSSLGSPLQLSGWNSSGGDPCGQSWMGVVCLGSAVMELKLSGLGLAGSMGYQLSNLTSLKNLDVSNNNLGGQIPYQLPPNVDRLDFSLNQFSGGIQYSVSQMVSLRYLNMSHNHLQGPLGDMFEQLTNLSTMDLSFNAFIDKLPQSFSYLSSMNAMYLQNNQFAGPIDILANLPLQNLNVANNHFSGWIPAQLRSRNIQIDGNAWSFGPAPPPPPYTPPPNRRTSPGRRSAHSDDQSNSSRGKKSGIGGGAIAGIIISILVVGAIATFFLLKRKPKRSLSEEKLNLQRPFTAPLTSNEVKEMKSIQTSSSINTKTLESSASFTLKPPPMDRHKSFDENELTKKPVAQRTMTFPVNARLYSIADLQMASGSFSIENLIGEGSIGRVYKAQFDDGKVMAVKKVDCSSLPNHVPEDFLEVVSSIDPLRHPNVTELMGYCCEHGQYLLVYEFHKNGSLHDFLHFSDEYSRPLTWNTRIKIALGTARALEYLHEVCSPSIIHKNIKSANILLDMELNPHLSDCGLANFVPNAEHQASDQNAGSGYSAPEVSMSGQYSLKSDIYSFGVVMLELLTGRKPFDSLRPRCEQSLVQWATPQLHDIDALAKMVDPSLRGLYPPKSLSRFADVIALCVQPEPEFRPPMSEVVEALVRLLQRAMSKRTTGEEHRHRRDDSDAQENMP